MPVFVPKFGSTPRVDDSSAPMLSIIITCFNYERYVGRAIRSVQSQANGRCEIIVVDDGSADGSWDEIGRSGVTAYRIENGGARAACIYGLGKTTAPFVLFLDADDELEPGSLDVILGHLDLNVAKLQFQLTRIDPDGNVISAPTPDLETFRGRQPAESVLKTGVYVSPPTSGNVFRRDLCGLLEEVDYESWVDGIMIFAAPFYGDIVSLQEPLGRYRIHDRNFSGLGRDLNPHLLRVELQRFTDRMAHLRTILSRLGVDDHLVSPKQTFFYCERSFYLAVSEDRRVPLLDVIQMLKILWSVGNFSVRTKGTYAAFLLLTVILPRARARRSLSYRLGAGGRSMFGLLRAVL